MHLETTECKKSIKDRFIKFMTVTEKTNISSMARETGINRKTIERIADPNHKRNVEFEEIEPICNYFCITFDQLDGSFLEKMVFDIEHYLNNMNYLTALDKAQEMMSKSIFPNEKVESHYYLGEALRKMGRLDDALSHINKGLDISLRSKNRDGTIRFQHQMMNYLFDCGKFEELRVFAEKCLSNSELTQNKRHLAVTKHYKGIALYYSGHRLESKRFYTESMNIYKEIGSEDLNLARIMATIADLEYFEGNYAIAISLLHEAFSIQTLKKDSIEYILKTKKDLARCYLKIGQGDTAKKIVDECIGEINTISFESPQLLGDLFIILLKATKSLDLAMRIIDDERISIEGQKDASDFIMDAFSKGGDISKEVLLKCYTIARK